MCNVILRNCFKRAAGELGPQKSRIGGTCLIDSRHVAEKGNFRVAERMFSSSLKICGEQAEAMPEQYANALFCSGSYASDTNQFRLHLELAQKHFDQRMKIESQKSALTLGTGRAHSELGLAYLLNNQYDKAIEHSIIARRSNEKLPEYLNGSYWPFFAIIHHAQALLGLNREAEALDMLLETLRWREVKYGPNDTESFKYGSSLSCLWIQNT
jgi:tetratricopeptide (TPR) repeat protein